MHDSNRPCEGAFDTNAGFVTPSLWQARVICVPSCMMEVTVQSLSTTACAPTCEQQREGVCLRGGGAEQEGSGEWGGDVCAAACVGFDRTCVRAVVRVARREFRRDGELGA